MSGFRESECGGPVYFYIMKELIQANTAATVEALKTKMKHM